MFSTTEAEVSPFRNMNPLASPSNSELPSMIVTAGPPSEVSTMSTPPKSRFRFPAPE